MTTIHRTQDAGLGPAPPADPEGDAYAETLIGDSPEIHRLRRELAQAAPTDMTVLLLGETGTGKGLAARWLHAFSPRPDGPFVQVNCTNLPEQLLESELFGHERGAFTGAVARKLGRVEIARGGTLFLDEIGELKLSAQAKLLRVLEEGAFERVGGTQTLQAQVRMVAATNKDLRAAVSRGRFRADLFYRLDVFSVQLPPLRTYRTDILRMAHHFIRSQAADLGRPAPGLSLEAEAKLQGYYWPGNVRELKNAVQRSVATCPGPTIRLEDLPPMLPPANGGSGDSFLSLEENERQHVRRVLEATGWTVKGDQGAAAVLRVPPSTLNHRIKKLGLVRPPAQALAARYGS